MSRLIFVQIKEALCSKLTIIFTLFFKRNYLLSYYLHAFSTEKKSIYFGIRMFSYIVVQSTSLQKELYSIKMATAIQSS